MKGNAMQRCHNNTTGVDEILAVLKLAEQLQRELASIEFVLTEQEQRGLYSIIRNLDFETYLKMLEYPMCSC